MLSRIVECVPNFSEARRPEVIEDILKSIRDIPGVYILDRHSDIDHNRTVITFVGDPDAVIEAAFQAISTASKLIDLNLHRGEHPRIGATDVVPLIPIRNISMQECVELARVLGKRVGTELGIPVYLYEDAATRQERKDLENIRRGQYERLKEEIGVDPNRKPDFGPSKLGPAGATVIGARQFLVAFNVFLNTDDIRIAHKIAKAIRHSSGGWHYLKSKGFMVEGRAQVSMNFTNYRLTPLARVVETIRREAERYGTSIHHSELVGLIPQQALADAAAWYLQLDEIHPQQIFEHHLHEIIATISSETQPAEQNLLEQIVSDYQGSAIVTAAALTAATACALSARTARISLDKSPNGNEQFLEATVKEAEKLRTCFFQAAYTPHPQVSIAYFMKMIKDLLALFKTVKTNAELGYEPILPDIACAASLASAAFSGIAVSLQRLLNQTTDQQQAQEIRQQIQDSRQQIQDFRNSIQAALLERGNLFLC